MTPQTLRIVLENVDFRLPTQVTDDNSVLALKSLVFEPLVRWQPHGEVLPGLFDSWRTWDGGRLWHFHIRENATFHDGKPCDSATVVEYVKGFLDSHDYFGMAWSYERYFSQTEIASHDDQTVIFKHPEPFADLLPILCDFWPSRISSDGKPVLGTGPYRVTEFERKENIGRATLQKLEASGNSLPHIILATMEGDGEERLKLLQSGQVDAALNLERADNLALIYNDSELQWGTVDSTLSVIYYLNCPSGIFSSPNIRLAANLAVDSDALVEQVYRGLATPSATVVSPHHLGFKESGLGPIPYDPAKARQLLEGVDFKEPLILRTPTYMPEHADKITKFVKSALEAVGFQVIVDLETNRPEYARSIGLRKKIRDLALFDSTPNTTFRVLDDKVSSESHGTWWLGYHDDEFLQLFKDARQTVIGGKRGEAYARCLRRLQQNPPWLYIAHPYVIWASRQGINLRIGPSGVLELQASSESFVSTG